MQIILVGGLRPDAALAVSVSPSITQSQLQEAEELYELIRQRTGRELPVITSSPKPKVRTLDAITGPQCPAVGIQEASAIGPGLMHHCCDGTTRDDHCPCHTTPLSVLLLLLLLLVCVSPQATNYLIPHYYFRLS